MAKLKVASLFLRRGSPKASPPSSPIYRLPPELLVEIFLHAIKFMPKSKDALLVRPNSLPLVISQVCSIWRDVAVECRSLWTRIAIYRCVAFPVERELRIGDPISDVRLDFPLTQLFLERSGEHPIDVEIGIEQPPLPQNWWACDHVCQLSDLLLPHVGRLRSLMVNHHSWECHRTLWERIFSASMPILEDLQFYHLSPVFSTVLALPNAQLCPSLKNMIISIPCRWQGFRHSNLTSLSFAMLPLRYCPTVQELVEILRFSKDTLDKVEILGTFTERGSEGSTSPDDRLTLPNVRMLRLGFYDARDVQKFLSCVAFPALKALVMINMHGDNAWGIMRDAYARFMSALFNAMIHLLPLGQITFLVLRYVEFREERLPVWASVEHSYVEKEDLPVPLKFMASLTSLRHLFLISPDNVTLTSMNYPIPFTCHSETKDSISRLPLVLPNLSVLRITALSPEKYSHVLDWIVQRHSILRATLAGHYHNGPFLRTLHLCLPEDAEVTINILGYPTLACEETISYRPSTKRMLDSVMHDNL
ncbi:hypothetical protein F5146DRAFT_57278 [Armillaria mellea]|nr:hypothetical protein F5146DRAFT_57278 [Armillaria mellea]